VIKRMMSEAENIFFSFVFLRGWRPNQGLAHAKGSTMELHSHPDQFLFWLKENTDPDAS
jgi:hypothetical protein